MLADFPIDSIYEIEVLKTRNSGTIICWDFQNPTKCYIFDQLNFCFNIHLTSTSYPDVCIMINLVFKLIDFINI